MTSKRTASVVERSGWDGHRIKLVPGEGNKKMWSLDRCPDGFDKKGVALLELSELVNSSKQSLMEANGVPFLIEDGVWKLHKDYLVLEEDSNLSSVLRVSWVHKSLRFE